MLKWRIALVEELSRSFYGNCGLSLNNEDQAQEFIYLAASIIRKSQFELRG